MYYSATYSPEDNKLRLSATSRLDAELYARVKAMGFSWAPRQEIFVAGMWTPEREDFLLELCGEIDDEDTSLVDRAAERAERFEGYSERRASDAASAERAVSAITSGIPLGQPILVGHHSEKRARKDAERIDNGMRRAISMWETSSYWTRRAASAIAHAKYLERPDVRYRRIKTLEAEKRKKERSRDEARGRLKVWAEFEALTPETALKLANLSGVYSLWSDLEAGKITPEEARERVTRGAAVMIEWAGRWIAHYENRIAYERAMLDEQGGTPALQWDLKPGGRVLTRWGWNVIKRVNTKDGAVLSVSIFGQSWTTGPEEIKDYREPDPEDEAKVKAVTKLPPICNFPGEGFEHVTEAEYKRRVPSWSDFPKVERRAATDEHGAYRVRVLPPATGGYWKRAPVYITDKKRVDPPAPSSAREEAHAELHEKIPYPTQGPARERPADEGRERAEALKETLGAGVAVVSAPQLFPTPPDLARRLVALAGVRPGHRVLEPSAGTGRLIDAIVEACPAPPVLLAVEINADLCARLESSYPFARVACTDFLTAFDDAGPFNRVVMNPPFRNGSDLDHVRRARELLAPGGRLVALVANGPRQTAALRDEASEWIELQGAFREEGTNVNVAIYVYDEPE